MKRRYVFDKDSLSFKKERLTLKKLGGQLVMFVLLSLSLTVAFYLVFSFFFNTKEIIDNKFGVSASRTHF